MTAYLFFGLVCLMGLFFIFAPFASKLTIWNVRHTASVFFTESSKPEVMKQTLALAGKEDNRKFRILIVPGHDNEFWGTQYKNVKEADMTLELGKEISRLLSLDSKFQVILSRDDSGYLPELATYFKEQEGNILSFVEAKKEVMSDLQLSGKISTKVDGVYHNNAPGPVAVRLYGINKWANENNIDLVIHVHFNDYPRRKRASPGDYSGFSIYVPEHQYSNARSSKDIATTMLKQLGTYYPESNMPKEDAGVVEDQDLIAIGSFNTLDPASILIEYGYIYEPQFLNSGIRSRIIEDFAIQTYVGIHNFFGGSLLGVAGKYNTALLPYTWRNTVSAGAQFNPSILSLQAALTLEGVFPPKDFDGHVCPLAGTYGACTKKSLAQFQKKYDINDTPGVFGTATMAKLNELYGE